MPLILRIDVDRPFGKRNVFRRTLSKIASELYFPRVRTLGYLRDLEEILSLINMRRVPSYVFFRRCTLPSLSVIQLMKTGNHVFGLHLENSRSSASFKTELRNLERHIEAKVDVFSKHGSGVKRYGLFHYAPYEPENYQIWGRDLGMKIFFGNIEDPTHENYLLNSNLQVLPAAFWLEPNWRDVKRFTIEWLIKESSNRTIVLLLHPDNVTADDRIMAELLYLIDKCKFSLFVKE